jgi:hypothetical protein
MAWCLVKHRDNFTFYFTFTFTFTLLAAYESWGNGGMTHPSGSGFCEHGNEPSGSIKGGEFLDQLNDCQLLKKDSGPWN